MVKFNERMIGKKVKFNNKERHEAYPEWYPEVGTIGEIIYDESGDYWSVKWPKGTVKENCYGKTAWYCDESCIDLYENEHLDDKKVYKMLIPKLDKNCPQIDWTTVEKYADEAPNDSIVKAIAVAYRSGYGRGKSNRNFAIETIPVVNKKQKANNFHAKENTVSKESKNPLIGKYVVLAKPSNNSVKNGYAIGNYGIIENIYDNGTVKVKMIDTLTSDTTLFEKSELLLITNDKYCIGDTVVCVEDTMSLLNEEYYPPVGTIMTYLGDGFYYTPFAWKNMSAKYYIAMKRNYEKRKTGISLYGVQFKKAVPLC